jgi:type 2A phosphatase activator TIP41
MPTCIFILSRFTLRVDNVLFRTHDTRMFHSFTSNPPLVVRQVSGWEAPYNRVKRVGHITRNRYYYSHSNPKKLQQLPRHDDLTPLTDANFIAKILTAMPTETSQMITGGTQWRGLRTKVEVSLVTRVGPYYEASR